jgi:Stealth protein CR2, conserved region 2/Stealth protein CR1, conserved region 1
MQQPIDAVILWVDGSDPQHQAKLQTYLASIGSARPSSANSRRFHDAGEINYCVTSILKFAPWIRRIHIVTDQQRPDIFDKLKGTQYEHKVQLVDHSLIFAEYPDAMPSFNSMAISSLLWKIPDLAEQFLYLNDDFVFIQPTTAADFFRGNKVVLRGGWHSQPTSIMNGFNKIFRPKRQHKISFWTLQQQAARLLGFSDRYFKLPHVPHAWTKSAWRDLFSQYPDAMHKNVYAHLRKPDLTVPESLSAHYHVKNNSAVIDNSIINVQLKPSEQSLLRIKLKLFLAGRSDRYIVSCVQSIEAASETKQKLIFDWLDRRIGKISQFLN